MAQKKITDLQQISAMTDGSSLPVDNGVQTYRATGSQLKTYLSPAYYPPSFARYLSGSGSFNLHYAFRISTGSATIGATYTHNSVTYTVVRTVASSTHVIMSGSAPPLSSGTLTKSAGTGDSTITFSEFRSPLAVEVSMVGGGGGGSGSGGSPSASGAGGNTTFGSNLTAGGGNGGGVGGATGGAGGGNTISEGDTEISIDGSWGESFVGVTTTGGGSGGNSFFTGRGNGGGPDTAGGAAATNSGSGGGGGGTNSASTAFGTGGGAGAFLKVTITAPAATYAYSVAAGGTAGGAGSNGRAGGVGGSGNILVKCRFQ